MLVTYCENAHQLQKAKDIGLNEVILGPKDLSRFGTLSIEDTNELVNLAHELKIKAVVEFDILITENNFKATMAIFNQLNFKAIYAIRVQDQGVLHYIFNNTDLKLQFIAETANHNLASLKRYENLLGDRLDRVVLSIELTHDKIKIYKNALKTNVEFLVLGRILLFYTPRNLLTPLTDSMLSYNNSLIATGESEESPHKGFPLIENKHGTFMFHIKHQYLLDFMDDLDVVDYKRVDLRFDADFNLIEDISKVYCKKLDAKEFKALYPFDTIRGFFKVNKSNVLFKKLKNQRVQRKDDNYIGEVIHAQKPNHLILHLKGQHKLELGQTIKFNNPEGKHIDFEIKSLKDLYGNELSTSKDGEFVQLKYHSSIWVKSQAYI
jgi:putative protease